MSFMPGFITPAGNQALTFAEMIAAAGQAADLKLCLDAADAASYAGTGQRFDDTSGQASHFVRGTGSGVQASDPPFIGTAGSKAADTYFQYAGGSVFTAWTPLTFASVWHRPGAAWTVATAVYFPVGGARYPWLFSTGTDTRLALYAQLSGVSFNKRSLIISGQTANGNSFSFRSPDLFMSEGQWIFIAMSHSDSGTGTNLWFCNGSWASGTGKFPASALGASGGYAIGGTPALAAQYMSPNGARLGTLAAWSRVLATGEVEAVYARVKQRYTTMP